METTWDFLIRWRRCWQWCRDSRGSPWRCIWIIMCYAWGTCSTGRIKIDFWRIIGRVVGGRTNGNIWGWWQPCGCIAESGWINISREEITAFWGYADDNRNSQSIIPHLVNDSFGFQEFVFSVPSAPWIQSHWYPVNDILLLSGLGEMGAALLIKAWQDLFQLIDGIILDVVSNLLILKPHVSRNIQYYKGNSPPRNPAKRPR